MDKNHNVKVDRYPEKPCSKGYSERQRREKLQKEVTLRVVQDACYLEITNGVVSSAGKYIPDGNIVEEHTLVNPNWSVVIRIFKKIYENNFPVFESLGQYLLHASISRTFYDAIARKEEIKLGDN